MWTWKRGCLLFVFLVLLTRCGDANEPVEYKPDAGKDVGVLVDAGPDGGIGADAAPDQACVPSCGGRECGDDGCGGSCGECASDASCSDAGVCVHVDCSGKEYELSGTFANSVQDFAFDTVEMALYHKKDIDPEEDGCIARVDLAFRKGTGCLLELRAEGAFDSDGRLRITEFNFLVDSQCPGFSDALEGEYQGLDKLTEATVSLQHAELVVNNVDSWCFPSSLTVHLAGTVFSLAAGAQIEVFPTTITVSGSFLSVGDEGLSCPCVPMCAGKECGGDGCGGKCGSCGPGFYCDQGTCKEGECIPDCDGKECGDDGCGGSCGICGAGYHCDQGTCKEGDCIPQCEGKDCGPDGCGGKCGTCSCGETCDAGICVFHACDGKQCGDDGCGGECGLCGEGTACSEGVCVEVGCQAAPFTLDGDFNNAISPITFSSVTASVVHKRDVDQWEDGCIASVELIFKKGTGCTLKVMAGESFDLEGHLVVQQVEFTADSQCPGFSDEQEGLYVLDGGLTSSLELGVEEVPGYDVEQSCFNSWMKVHLQGSLAAGLNKKLTVLPTLLHVAGDFLSDGSYQAKCPCKPSCQGKECGDAGCGLSCGTCGCGEGCDEGACVFHACDGKDCGSDGCGGTCGTCGCGEGCDEGACVFHACAGKECGPDGCGGSCGSCQAGELCSEGGVCEDDPTALSWKPIPGGTFTMGCSPGDGNCGNHEKPAHSVTLSPFEILETEVTEAQYEAVTGEDPSCDYGVGGGPDSPVECIDWYEAKAFCEAVGGRLCTEAEWEYAARGGTTTKYYCGDSASCLSGIAWYNNNSGSHKHDVKGKAPNAYGLYDMLGNVFEWTADWYSSSYYSVSPANNPPGPNSGSSRVSRGGSFFNFFDDGGLRVSYRGYGSPSGVAFVLGGRCCRSE